MVDRPPQQGQEYRHMFTVFFTSATLPSMAGIQLWNSHEQLMHLNPHYMTLLIGGKTVADPFRELGEANFDPQCFVMRFQSVSKLSAVQTALAHRIVDVADFLNEHESLEYFPCGYKKRAFI